MGGSRSVVAPASDATPQIKGAGAIADPHPAGFLQQPLQYQLNIAVVVAFLLFSTKREFRTQILLNFETDLKNRGFRG